MVNCVDEKCEAIFLYESPFFGRVENAENLSTFHHPLGPRHQIKISQTEMNKSPFVITQSSC